MRSICQWQCRATQLYITMRALFTVSRLQGWSFCKAPEKGKESWWGSVVSHPLGGGGVCPSCSQTFSGHKAKRATELAEGA